MSRNQKILVVDDYALNRMATVMVMNDLGFDVDQAESGKDALELIKSNAYALIMMDYNMPEMTGVECVRQIRSNRYESLDGNYKTTIIGFSGSTEDNVRELCLEAGMDAYLDKSCSVEELKATIDKFLRQ